jgi:hypothetical protein
MIKLKPHNHVNGYNITKHQQSYFEETVMCRLWLQLSAILGKSTSAWLVALHVVILGTF